LNQAIFQQRLQEHHSKTGEVIANLNMSGQARFLDATASPDWVEAAALSHFSSSVVFVRGGDCSKRSVACKAVAASTGAIHLCFDSFLSGMGRLGQTLDHLVVQKYIGTLLLQISQMGSLIILDGFPHK